MVATSQLRRWQQDALAEWLPLRSGCVEVATGGGKTLFSFACWSALGKEPPVVVIVPTRALADQWFVNAREDGGLQETEVRILSSKTNVRDLRRFNIVVINSARSIDPNIWPADRFLVVDECHRAGSVENAKALRGRLGSALGLSATPERQYDEGFAERVVPVVGPVIFRYSVAEALRDGVLSEFELVNVKIPLTEPEQTEFDRLSGLIARLAGRLRTSGADSSDQIEALLRKRSRLSALAAFRVPVAVRLVERDPGARTIVFHESITDAERIAHLLKERGHSATTYHSGLGEHIRRENLRMFRRGIFDVLVTCRALDEGANIPETRVAVVVASTASDRQRIQRLGRVLRPAPGKSSAVVYTIYATPQEESRLLTESSGFEGLSKVTWTEVGAA